MNPFVAAHPILFTLIIFGVLAFHAFALYAVYIIARLFFSQWR